MTARALKRTHWLYEPESFVPAAQLVDIHDQRSPRMTGTGRVVYSSHVSAEGTTAQPQLYFIHTDHLGTPQELTDRDGNLQWVGQYRAWGELEEANTNNSEGNAATVEMPLRFQGQYFDEETGLHYNRFRYYDPQIGRFTTQDPFSLVGGFNLYQYAPNPIQWVDIFGLYNGEGERELGVYDVFHEHTLDPSEYKMTDREQFKLANESVHKRLQTDSEFRQMMEKEYPKAIKDVQPSSRGNYNGNSPTGLTWHHGEEPGSLQLVDRADHRVYHKIYHPTDVGGRNIWGGGTECRHANGKKK